MPPFPVAELRSLASSHIARLVLLKQGPKRTGSFNVTISFLRLSDFAVGEYLRARSALISFAKQRAVNRFCDGVCHLENCIVSIHRSLLFVRQIRKLRLVTHDNNPIVIRSRNWKVIQAQDRLRKVRNSIQHLDAVILKGEERIVFAIRPGERTIELADTDITYSELCEWVVEINQLSKIISSSKEN